jgi:hypothetical protein
MIVISNRMGIGSQVTPFAEMRTEGCGLGSEHDVGSDKRALPNRPARHSKDGEREEIPVHVMEFRARVARRSLEPVKGSEMGRPAE